MEKRKAAFIYMLQLYPLRMSGAKIQGWYFKNFPIFRPHKNASFEILTGFTCMLNDTIQDVKAGASPQAWQKNIWIWEIKRI